MDFLEEDDISAESLRQLIGDEFGDAEVEGNKVIIECDGFDVKLIHSEEMGAVGLSAKWDASDDTSESRAVRELNEWNRYHSFAFAYIWDGQILAEHQISCKGGIRAETLKDTLGRFIEAGDDLDKTLVTNGFFEYDDDDYDENESPENDDSGELPKIDAKTLRDRLASKYDNIEVDDDGDIVIHTDEKHIFIMLDDERKFLRLNTRWNKGESISENRAARVMNAWNEKKIFTTAYLWGDTFMLDYYMSYEGGLNFTNLTDSLNWFLIGANQFGDMLKDEDAI